MSVAEEEEEFEDKASGNFHADSGIFHQERRTKKDLYDARRTQISVLLAKNRQTPYDRGTNPIMPSNKPSTEEWPKIRTTPLQTEKLSNMFSPQQSDQLMDTTTAHSSNDDNPFIKPKKTGKHITSSPTVTPTTNAYGVLTKLPEQEEETVVTPRKTWVPPIIINSEITDYKKFVEKLTRLLGHTNYTISLTKRSVKLVLRTDDDHARACADLKAEKMAFHTYPKASEKLKKIVLKAAPHMEQQDLQESLKANNIVPTEIIPLKGKNVSHSYLLTLPKTYQINDVRKVENLENLKVTWEKYERRRNYTQCFNCQGFGHGQTNCNNPARCVKCPGKHHYSKCTLVKTAKSKAHCCNCGGQHTANFSKCPSLLQYLQIRNQNINLNQANSQNSQTQSNKQKTFSTRRAQNNFSYAQAAGSSEHSNNSDSNNFFSLINTLKTDNDMSEIVTLLKLIIEMKTKLKNAHNSIDKLTIISEYLDKF